MSSSSVAARRWSSSSSVAKLSPPSWLPVGAIVAEYAEPAAKQQKTPAPQGRGVHAVPPCFTGNAGNLSATFHQERAAPIMGSIQRRLLGTVAVHRSAPERTSPGVPRGKLPVGGSPSLSIPARLLFSINARRNVQFARSIAANQVGLQISSIAGAGDVYNQHLTNPEAVTP